MLMTIDNLLLWESGQLEVACRPALRVVVGLWWILAKWLGGDGGGGPGQRRVSRPKVSSSIDLSKGLTLYYCKVRVTVCFTFCLGGCSLLAESPGWGWAG